MPPLPPRRQISALPPRCGGSTAALMTCRGDLQGLAAGRRRSHRDAAWRSVGIHSFVDSAKGSWNNEAAMRRLDGASCRSCFSRSFWTVAGAPVVMFRHSIDVRAAESVPNLNSRWRRRYDALCLVSGSEPLSTLFHAARPRLSWKRLYVTCCAA